MAEASLKQPQNPLILRCSRLMEAFAKSDDERDFYLDRQEGFLVMADLDKSEEELQRLQEELQKHANRYCPIPKFSFYETKKIMEGFVNEKVYDIDTKEKLLDIIQSKDAREHFLEFIFEQHTEMEKWQLYYQERSRIRIIEWLRNNHFHFVFEEDLDLPTQTVEKLKTQLFDSKVGKDVQNARKVLVTKAKTYYSSEALNPRPKRGRPPKQTAKPEVEMKVSLDIYTTVTPPIRPFLFTPDITGVSAATFSSKFESEGESFGRKHGLQSKEAHSELHELNEKLATLRSLSQSWMEKEKEKEKPLIENIPNDTEEEEEEEDEEDLDELDLDEGFDPYEEEEEEEEEEEALAPKKATPVKKAPVKKAKLRAAPEPKKARLKTVPKKPAKASGKKK